MKTKYKGIIFISLILVILAPIGLVQARGNTTYRPLSDWETNNPTVFLGWRDEFAGLIYFIENAGPLGDGTPPDEGSYDGYIREKTLKDSTAELTLVLWGKNLRFWLYKWIGTPGNPSGTINFAELLLDDAFMKQYYVKLKFTMPEPGAEIPSVWALMGANQIISWLVYGKGSGIFTEYAVGFSEGQPGYVKALFIGLFQAPEKLAEKLHYGVWLTNDWTGITLSG
jgi:hypothetical protein